MKELKHWKKGDRVLHQNRGVGTVWEDSSSHDVKVLFGHGGRCRCRCNTEPEVVGNTRLLSYGKGE